MRIYTKSGDQGETGLIGGARTSKADARICAIGEVDELNASLGVLMMFECTSQTKTLLEKIQSDLFTIGAQLADPGTTSKIKKIAEQEVSSLEKAIDRIEKKLHSLTSFILPGGTPFAAHAHLARAICRRAERAVAGLFAKKPGNPQIIIYLNRLSDLLFMLAREEMHDSGTPETPWSSA